MKKHFKLAAGVLIICFCIIMGCEKKEEQKLVSFSDAGMEQEMTAEVQSYETVKDLSGQSGEALQEAGDGCGSAQKVCVVHICGAVVNPGVYTLEEGSRIYQAVEKAGGFREDAREDYLNQADLIVDGMKVYVPTCEETKGALWEDISESAGAGQEGLVNINTADEERLCTLPGVGSAKAKSIIAYREKNGSYQKIEDIMNVEGIKEGLFQKIKDSITV